MELYAHYNRFIVFYVKRDRPGVWIDAVESFDTWKEASSFVQELLFKPTFCRLEKIEAFWETEI